MEEQYYQVIYSEYSQSHYSKDFKKKYKLRNWTATLVSLKALLTRYPKPIIPGQESVTNCDLIKHDGDGFLAKVSIRVDGTNVSATASGNRAIIYADYAAGTIEVLLIYTKGHHGDSASDTVWWQEHIKRAFPGIAEKYC